MGRRSLSKLRAGTVTGAGIHGMTAEEAGFAERKDGGDPFKPYRGESRLLAHKQGDPQGIT